MFWFLLILNVVISSDFCLTLGLICFQLVHNFAFAAIQIIDLQG